MEERQIEKILWELAMASQVLYERFAEGWILRVNGIWVHGYHFGLNDAAASKICDDKAATYDILKRAKVPSVPHWFVTREAIPNFSEKITRFQELVVKPNEGTGGHDVVRVSSELELHLALEKLFTRMEQLAVSPFLLIEVEYRVIVLREKAVLVYAKRKPAEGWLFNLGQGAVPEVLAHAPSTLTEMAIKATQALGVTFASVDIVRVDRRLYVLEVNSGVMLEHFSQLSDENYALAKEIYQKALGL